MNRLCWAPRRLCLWMVFTLVNLSHKHSGTRLLAVLNIKYFNCLARLNCFLDTKNLNSWSWLLNCHFLDDYLMKITFKFWRLKVKKIKDIFYSYHVCKISLIWWTWMRRFCVLDQFLPLRKKESSQTIRFTCLIHSLKMIIKEFDYGYIDIPRIFIERSVEISWDHS